MPPPAKRLYWWLLPVFTHCGSHKERTLGTGQERHPLLWPDQRLELGEVSWGRAWVGSRFFPGPFPIIHLTKTLYDLYCSFVAGSPRRIHVRRISRFVTARLAAAAASPTVSDWLP